MIQKFSLLDFAPLLLGVFSLFFSHAFAATESVRIIRQDCTGYANCYTSLAAWDVAEERDLVALNEIAVARIEGTWTNPDTTAVDIYGWTTGVNNYVKIYTTTEARHSGVWSTSAYRLEPTDANALIVGTSYAIIDGLQIRTVSPTVQRSEFSSHWNPGGVVTLSNSIIRGSGVNSVGVSVDNAQVGNIILYNNIIYGAQNQYFGGVTYNGVGTLRAYNNTIIDSYYGFRRSNGTIVAKNNIVINPSSSAYLSDSSVAWGTGSDYNISSDGTSTSGAHDKISQTVLFSDSANYNYHLSFSDTSALDAGVDLSADPDLSFTTDIDGETRSGTWDIGADEYVYVPPPDTTPPVRSNGSPSGVFSSGTSNVTLSLVTDEDATCKYSTVFSTDYASTQFTFTTTGSTAHSASIGVTSSQSYTYYIRCRDTAGNANIDAYGISFSVSSSAPSDATPPSTPAGLVVSAVEPSRISLAWEDSRDNNGVVGYHIYRNGVYVRGTTETTYTDIDLTPSTTYIYAVSAYDTANNFSPKSIEVSAETKALVETVASSSHSPPPPQPEPPAIIRPSYHFSNDRLIMYGMKNTTDIYELQKILQYEGLLPNTPFALDGVFLEATKNAVIKFQEKYGLVLRDGKVGPVTKKKLNELYDSSSAVSPTKITYILRNLTLGSRGDDVKKLQQLLNADMETRISATGSGSPGNETTYFGLATKAAVIKYQKKNNICPADGYVGPVTRGKLEGR